MAAALIQSPEIGAAGEAISQLPLTDRAFEQLTSHEAVDYAESYFIGSIAAIWCCCYLVSKLLGVDLAKKALDLGRSLDITKDPSDATPGCCRLPLRAHPLPSYTPVAGMRLG